MIQFGQALEQASARVRLNELRRQLTHEEVLIVTDYLEKLIASRPKGPAVAAKVIPIRKEQSLSEQLQEELEPLPNSNLKYAV